jgi:hypothetical protein
MPQPIPTDVQDPTPPVPINPLAYLPEQSTAIVIPATAINIPSGSLGTWLNPTAALVTSGNGANVTTNGSGVSNFLQCAPAPAGTYASMSSGAAITRIIANFETFGQKSGLYLPENYLVLMGNNARYGAARLSTITVDGSWNSRTIEMTKDWYFPAGLTGAQWINGDFGPGFQIENSDPNEAGINQIKSVTMQVFFQNPIASGETLILCEA